MQSTKDEFRLSAHLSERWLDYLIVPAAVVLALQIFPDLPSYLGKMIDAREWSRSTWFAVNVGALCLLLLLRFAPLVFDALKQRQAMPSAGNTSGPLLRSSEKVDVRVQLRRDEELRARRRQRLSIYGFAAIIVAASGIGSLLLRKSDQHQAAISSNMLLHSNRGANFRHGHTGMIGLRFRVAGGRSLLATQVGVYDSAGDGLQHGARAGIFSLEDSELATAPAIAEAFVPCGTQAKLEAGFRWVTLAEPVELKAGGEYMLAAELSGEWMGRRPADEERLADSWPITFDDSALTRDGFSQAWNPLIVGNINVDTEALWMSEEMWPNCPDRAEPTEGVAHGPVNLVISEAN